MNMHDDYTLKRIRAYQDPDTLRWFLSVDYEVTNKYRTKLVTIPKIYLPIGMMPAFTINSTMYGNNESTIDLGFGKLEVWPDKNKHLFTEQIIEERAEEVTMEDIEKKFGHKVKIVSNNRLEDLL